RPPQKLNFQDPNWDAWRSCFQSFRAETKLDQEKQDIQIATLRYSMGPESEKVFETFNMDPNTLTYDQVLAKFDWFFKAKKKNVITLRRSFQNRMQKPKETVQDFCDSLKESALECEFPDAEERVRDQFIFGVKNKNLSQKLEQLFVINPAEFTLNKVVLVAKAFERSYAHDFLSLNSNDKREKRVNNLKGSIKIKEHCKQTSQ
ncbi:hypothetical protein FHG87_021961, partial [Trinorchestia longiramus]